MSAHNHAEHVAGCFRCELSREEAMTDRRCDHDTSHHDYEMRTLGGTTRIDRVCDSCCEATQSWEADTEEDA